MANPMFKPGDPVFKIYRIDSSGNAIGGLPDICKYRVVSVLYDENDKVKYCIKREGGSYVTMAYEFELHSLSLTRRTIKEAYKASKAKIEAHFSAQFKLIGE